MFVFGSTKLARFRVLNKHFFWRLDPVKHCKNDTLVINQSACQALDKVGVASKCSMIALVPVIHVDFDLPYDPKPVSAMPATNCSSHQDDDSKSVDAEDLPITSVLSALARAVSGSKLRTLNFAESSKSCSGCDLEVISELIEEVDAFKQPITLDELMIELKGERLHSSTTDYQFIPWVDMSTLFRSETLHTIRLVLYGCEFDDLPEQLQTLKLLPSSLTEFQLFHDWKLGEHVLPDLLQNPDWLPNIQHLDLDGDITSHPSLLTTMRATGLPRQYTYIEMMLADETLSHARFETLEHLGLVLGCKIWSSFQQFAFIDNTSFPNLKSFSLNEEFGPRPEGGCDLNPLIMFLSQRSMEKIVLRLWVEGSAAYTPFTDESVLALAQLRSLTQLRLDYLSAHQSWPEDFRLFESDDIRGLILPNSWPNMSELSVVSAMPITALEAFFHACPQLQSVVWRHQNKQSLIPLAVMSMIDKHCPTIEKISLFADHSAPTCRHDVFYAANLNFSLSRLHTLWIHDDNVTNRSLHLLISKVSHASIQDFMLQSPPPDSVRWSIPEVAIQVVMQRKLRALKCMWFPKDPQLAAKLEEFNRQLPDGRSWPFSALEFMPEELLVRGKLAFGVDETGQTSLETICEYLLNYVRPNEQRNLQFFDNNNYDVVGWADGSR